MNNSKFRQSYLTLLTIILAVFVFQSCGNNNAPQPSELEGFWILKSLNGKEAKAEFKGALPTVQFNFQDSLISGTSGCNRYNGKFTYNKGKLSAPNLATTQRLCIDANSEPQFLSAIGNTNKLSIENGILVFTYDSKVVLEFVKDSIATNQE